MSGYSAIPDSGDTSVQVDDSAKRSPVKVIVGVAVGVALVTAVILSVTLTQSGPGPNVLSNAVSAQLAQTHLSNLLDLVNNDVYQNSRSVRLGYNTSLKYVADTLAEQAPSFVQSTQSFPVQIWELIGTPSFISSGLGEFAYNVDYAVPPYGHPGVLTDLPLTVHLDVYCEQFETGKTGALLILRGNCTYAIKAENAIAAGYDALIIVNNVPDGIPQVTLGADYDIVVVTTTEAAGLSVVVAHETEAQLISVSVSSQIEDTVTTNLCADTPDGDASTVVVLGSHLDSVDAGPGMNDNGSGSAANLVLAIKFYELGLKATNKLRFCWWAAEEIGLIGSTKYVEQASATGEINNIAAYINYDMLGSPNYRRGLYNVLTAPSDVLPDVVNASQSLEGLFAKFYNENNYPFIQIPMDGRSDYRPFIEAQIPATAIETGAETLKTVAERDIFGGSANVPFDSCYHQACDTLSNVNLEVYQSHIKALGQVVQKLAETSDLRQALISQSILQ